MNSEQLSPQTFGNQDKLPHLPVLDLDETCNKFMAWVTPLLDEVALAETKQAVEAFRREGGPGPKLQEALLAWAEQDLPNWLEPFWDDVYLKPRMPIVINSNYFVLLKDPPSGPMPQIERAARLITSLLKFKALLDSERLPPDQIRGTPLCMMQFRRLFSTTRVPRRGRDYLRSPVSEEKPTPGRAKHIIVLHNGHIFALDVLSKLGKIRPLADLEQDLETILEMSRTPVEREEEVGLLTTANRDEWAAAREKLLALDPRNEQVFDRLETALFAVCLEDTSPEVGDDIARLMLYGDGYNRWFDKSMQFVVYQNGKAAMHGEHSGHDATTPLRLIDFAQRDNGQAKGAADPVIKTDSWLPQRLEFHLNDEVRQLIQKADRDFAAFVAATQLRTMIFDEFGKEFIKSLKVSPDGFVQVALQVAQYKLFGRCYSTYESVMTRQFLHGRTEAMRSVTPEAVACAQQLTAADSDQATQAEALRTAIQAHVNRIKECQAAHGVNRHLFGWWNIYRRQGAALGLDREPALFSSPGWTALGHDTLSTSNGSLDSLDLFGFGPVVDDGFGIGYIIHDERLAFTFTSRTAMQAQLEQFITYVEESLREMAAVLGG